MLKQVHNDCEWLQRQAQECIDNNDTMALSQLMAKASQQSEHSALLDTVMANDCIDMARSLFERFQIKAWCEHNTERMIRTCPDVFDHWVRHLWEERRRHLWAESPLEVARTIGRALDSWCDSAK